MNSQQDVHHEHDGDDGIDLLEVAQSIADRLRLLLLGPLAVGIVVLAITFVVSPTFTATTRFLPPQEPQSSFAGMLQSAAVLSAIAGSAGGLRNPADQYVAFTHSQSVADALIERFKLMERYKAKYIEDARRELDERSRIKAGPKDGLVVIEVDDRDPKFAADLANGYIEELGKLMSRIAVTEAQRRRQFFESQVKATRTALARAEQSLRGSGLGLGALKASPQAAVEALAKLRAAVTAQEVKLASMRSYLKPEAAEFRQASAELAALRSQLARYESDDAAAGQQGQDSEYVAKLREYRYQETLLDLFAKQYEIARVDEGRDNGLIQVVDYAKPPEKKSGPKRAKLAIMAALGTFALLLIYVIGSERWRKTSNDELSGRLGALKDTLARKLRPSRQPSGG